MMPKALETFNKREDRSMSTMDNDPPGCVIEEIPWEDALQDNEAEKMEKAEPETGTGEVKVRKTGTHGPWNNEQLALVFQLRGHIADLEHRASIMGQHIDLLLDALSGVPAQRKCPLCMQSFSILMAADGSDTSPGD
jgi:hypothetical protein